MNKFVYFKIKNSFCTNYRLWLSLSLLVAIFYGIESISYALNHPEIIQDDARHHIIWMRRFIDPELFPNDLIADYFRSVAPWGFTTLYWILAKVGIDPVFAGKIIPAILAIVITYYGFKLSLKFLPLPIHGFITTLLLNQTLWMEDDIISATPRAFIYPLFIAFLYYLIEKRLFAILLIIALQGLFYPQFVLIYLCLLTIRLVDKTSDKFRWQALLFGIIVSGIILIPYRISSNEFGPIITVAEAKLLPTFNLIDREWGRNIFFINNPLIYWLLSPRSGLLFLGLLPPLALTGILLPFLLKRKQQFPLINQVSEHIIILKQIILTSVGLFCLSHLFLFQLHFPNRYIYHSVRVTLVLAAGVTLTIFLDQQYRYWKQKIQMGMSPKQWIKFGVVLSLGLILIILPFFPPIATSQRLYRTGNASEIYQFLLTQPKDSLVASISEEADYIPTFAQRSTLVSLEYSMPYHSAYYTPLRQKTIDLIQAQYSTNWQTIRQFIQKYSIDFWLLDRQAFEVDYIQDQKLIRDVDQEKAVQTQLKQGIPVLSQAIESCSILQTEDHILLSAHCIKKRAAQR
ncbi:MAG: hypothetical protein WBA13_09635 [Microcoleaceae cyanobacterium]